MARTCPGISALVVVAVAACGGTSTADLLPTTDHEPGAGKRRAPAASEQAPPADAGAYAAPVDAGAPPPTPSCTLDTRTVYVEAGKKIESITAYGKYWVRVLASDGTAVESDGFPREVDAEPKFTATTGPCHGRTGCVLDTRVVYFDGAAKVESITAYGNYYVWSFDAQGNPVPAPSFPQALPETPAFAAGPCALAVSTVPCVLDTRTLEMTAAGKIEAITARGRWFSHVVRPDLGRIALPSNGILLEDVPRFAAGPCKTQPSGACTFDTRTVYTDLDGIRTEEVTARGRLWAYRLSATDAVVATVADGVPLDGIARFDGPCAH